MNEKLFAVFTRVLPGAQGKKANELVAGKIKGWDSLGHLKLIMALEKEFNVRFDTEEIPTLTSFELIDQAIQKVK
jgi:acyl carrier protein